MAPAHGTRYQALSQMGESTMDSLIYIGLWIGFCGTVAMDVWAFAQFAGGIGKRPHWGAVGRWVVYLPRGKVFHDDIGQVPEVAGENAIGWLFHYAVGLIYGVIFVLWAGADWVAAPTFLPVWIFALLTIAAGWFLLQPGLGLGIAASRNPNPWRTRIMGLIAHSWFGLGMWLGAVVI